MKGSEIKIGAVYLVKVSEKLAPVQVTGRNPFKGWDGKNLHTGRRVHVVGAGRFRKEVPQSVVARLETEGKIKR